jgi:tetratricopeptide (TPR) repeat protein
LVKRAGVRAERGSPDADADVARARKLGVKASPDLVRIAALAAIAGDLRHTDPERRERGRARLMLVDGARARALAGEGEPNVIGDTAAWLEAVRAYRVMYEMLDERVHAHGIDSLRAAEGAADRWLASRRWWGGPEGRPDLVSVERAEAMGASPCWFPRDGNGCNVIAAGGSKEPNGPAWEAALVTHWERAGVRAANADEAAAWMIVARRAAARGQIASYERAVRDHVDVEAMSRDPRVPTWAKKELARILAGEPSDESVAATGDVALERALDAGSWPEAAAALVTGDEATRAALVEVARAHALDSALADRRAEDVIAANIDVAAAAPVLARLFSLLDDPARARALWQRAADASPEDADIALELAIAMADAGDPAAGLVQMIRAAAGWGDAGAAMLRGARSFAAAGHTVEALTLVKSALSLAAPGDEAPVAAVAAALLDELGRTADAAALRALAPNPAAWDGRDATFAVETASSDARATGPRRHAGLARLAALTTASDPATARLAARALRELLAGKGGGGGLGVR